MTYVADGAVFAIEFVFVFQSMLALCFHFDKYYKTVGRMTRANAGV
jgi:hypothetical protein